MPDKKTLTELACLRDDQAVIWSHEGRRFALRVYTDPEPLDPRDNEDNLCTLLCSHPRYTLGDHPTKEMSGGWLADALQTDISAEALLAAIKSDTLAAFPKDELVDPDCGGPVPDSELLDRLFDLVRDGDLRTGLLAAQAELAWLPLWLYDHSGICMSCGERKYPFNDRWDSGCVGFAVLTRKKLLERLSDVDARVSKTANGWQEKALEIIRSEVERYNAYISGDVYCFDLLSEPDGPTDVLSDWNEEETGSGFLGSDFTENGMLDFIGAGLKEAIDAGQYKIHDLKTRTVTITSLS